MSNKKLALLGRGGLCAAVATMAAVPAIATASAPRATGTTTVLNTGKVKRGTVVVSATGRTIYGFSSDHGKSTCYGNCAKVWTPFMANGNVLVKSGSGLSQRLVGRTKRTNGLYQATYGGHPLYLYTGDKRVGQQNGEAKKQFGGSWYVISPSGALLKPSSNLVGGY